MTEMIDAEKRIILMGKIEKLNDFFQKEILGISPDGSLRSVSDIVTIINTFHALVFCNTFTLAYSDGILDENEIKTTLLETTDALIQSTNRCIDTIKRSRSRK